MLSQVLFARGDRLPIAQLVQFGLQLVGYTNNGKLVADGEVGNNTLAAIEELTGRRTLVFTMQDLWVLVQKLRE